MPASVAAWVAGWDLFRRNLPGPMAPAGDNFSAPFPQSPLPVAVDLFMFNNWVEVTRLNNGQAGVYARDAVTVARGRTSEGGVTDPTVVGFTLNNRDGRFSPRNPVGPYYGQIGRNTQARVRVGNDVRGVGEVTAWPPKWTGAGEDVWTPVVASGVTRRLGQSGPLRSAPVRYIPGTAPVAYWPMEDGPLAAWAAPLAGKYLLRPFVGTHPSGAVVTTPQWGQGTLAPWLPPVTSRDGDSTLTILWAPVTMPAFVDTWTVDLMYASGTDSSVSVVDINPSYLPAGALGWPQLTLTPQAGVTDVEVSFNSETETAATVRGLYDSLPHHIRWTATQAATKVSWVVSVDGTTVNSGTTAGAFTLPAITTFGLGTNASTGSGRAQGHVAVWTTPPTLATAVSAAFGWRGETATARMTRLCAEESIPFTAATGSVAPALVGPQRPAPLIELLRAAADVDQGILYEPRDTLGLAYRPAATLYNQAPVVTLNYAAADLSPPLEPVEDDQATRNDWTITRDAGATGTAELDTGPLSVQDPPDGVGRYANTATLDLYADAQIPDAANWRLHLGTVDEARYPQVNLHLSRANYTAGTAAQALAGQAADLDVGDALTITNPPAWLPPGSIAQLATAFVERLSAFERTITVTCVPASPWTVGVYDATTSRYSSDGSTLGADAAAGITSLTVVTATGPVWSHADGDFDLLISGEQVTVTAVTGAASPQTFTVTRAVNGVAKTLPAGSAVGLAQPAVYAL